MDTVYIETSIVSYLRQRPSAQVVMAARQLLTHQWWNNERAKYEVVASQYVIDEASAGDPTLEATAEVVLELERAGRVAHCAGDVFVPRVGALAHADLEHVAEQAGPTERRRGEQLDARVWDGMPAQRPHGSVQP